MKMSMSILLLNQLSTSTIEILTNGRMITLSELGWNTSELGGLLTYLEESNKFDLYF